MFKIRTSVILLIAAALSIFTWNGSARAEEVSVSYAALTASYMDHLVALERGYFAEEGLTFFCCCFFILYNSRKKFRVLGLELEFSLEYWLI